MTVRTTFTRFGAQLACAGLAATLLVGFAATSANAETAGVKLALVQSVSFVADSQGDLLFASGPTQPGVLVTDGTGSFLLSAAMPRFPISVMLSMACDTRSARNVTRAICSRRATATTGAFTY